MLESNTELAAIEVMRGQAAEIADRMLELRHIQAYGVEVDDITTHANGYTVEFTHCPFNGETSTLEVPLEYLVNPDWEDREKEALRAQYPHASVAA